MPQGDLKDNFSALLHGVVARVAVVAKGHRENHSNSCIPATDYDLPSKWRELRGRGGHLRGSIANKMFETRRCLSHRAPDLRVEENVDALATVQIVPTDLETGL